MDNTMFVSINTDRELATILGRFSDDSIEAAIDEAIVYKYRPYENRMPNLPEIIYNQFRYLLSVSTIDHDEIKMRELEVYKLIIDKICTVYQLSIEAPEIPADKLYPLAYLMYQIFVSEFTQRMLTFFSNYINMNKDMLINSIPDDKRIDRKSVYAKRMIAEQDIAIVYENLDYIMDIIAGLDIPFANLLEQLSDPSTAMFIDTYINDAGDLYKHHYAMYISSHYYRTDMLTSIKLRYMSIAGVQMALTAPPTVEQ
jgi:hypothetical protein